MEKPHHLSGMCIADVLPLGGQLRVQSAATLIASRNTRQLMLETCRLVNAAKCSSFVPQYTLSVRPRLQQLARLMHMWVLPDVVLSHMSGNLTGRPSSSPTGLVS